MSCGNIVALGTKYTTFCLTYKEKKFNFENIDAKQMLSQDLNFTSFSSWFLTPSNKKKNGLARVSNLRPSAPQATVLPTEL